MIRQTVSRFANAQDMHECPALSRHAMSRPCVELLAVLVMASAYNGPVEWPKWLLLADKIMLVQSVEA